MPATMSLAAAASAARCTCAPAASAAASNSSSSSSRRLEGVVLDAPRLLAELLPVGQLGDGRGAARADRLRRAAQVGAQLRVGERLARRGREVVGAAHEPRLRAPPAGSSRAPPPGSSAARISARCTARTAGPPSGRRRRQPAQPAADVQQARRVDGGHDLGARGQDVRALVGQHGQRDVGVLDGEGAAEAAALGRPPAAPAARARARWRAAAAARRRCASPAASGRSGEG